MQNTDLFLSLAEIAGVFVGFGALISVRSGGAGEAHEVSYIRPVVTLAVCVVVAALAPVIISRYDLAGHELWLVCSVLTLVLFLGLWTMNFRTPEMQEEVAATKQVEMVRVVAANALLVVPMLAALILVVLGLFPDREPALYLTAVGLILFLDALNLLLLAFSQRRVSATADRGEPASRGTSA